MVCPPAYAPVKRKYALKTDVSLGGLKGGLIRVEELNRSLDATDGGHALAAGFKATSGGQSERSRGHKGRDGGGRGKRDGKDR